MDAWLFMFIRDDGKPRPELFSPLTREATERICELAYERTGRSFHLTEHSNTPLSAFTNFPRSLDAVYTR